MTKRRNTQHPPEERGAGTLTTILLLPMLIIFVEIIVLGGRVAGAQAELNAAAREAARQAAIAQSATSAEAVVDPVVNIALSDSGFECQSPSVQVDATNFTAGGTIVVDVQCQVQVSDLSLLNLPGSIEFHGSAAEPIDTYRVVE